MITKLTSAQIDRMAEYRDKWMRIGLSTEPCDLERSKLAVADAYRMAGLNPPATFYIFDSPISAAIVAGIFEAKVWGQVWDQVRDQVWDQAWDQVRAKVWDQVYGNHDAGWLSYFDFMLCELGVSGAEKLRPLMTLAEHCGWWAPYKRCAVLQHRPTKISLADGLLHCETGAAIQYRDGFAVHAWRGTRVPPHWIENRHNLDPREVLRDGNVERRAAGCAIIGWPKMLGLLQAKTIDKHDNPAIGELIEVTLPGLPEPGRFLKAECPRNGTICEGVPHVSDIDGLPIDTAIAAQAYRLGDPQSDYQPPKRRT